jgi:hypothetical protein
MGMRQDIKKRLSRARDESFHAADRLMALLPACGRFAPPKGYFSARQRLESGSLKGHVIFDHQPSGDCPAGSMTETCGMRQHDYQPWPVFWTLSQEARLTGRLRQWRERDGKLCLEDNYGRAQRNWPKEGGFWSQVCLEEPQRLEGAWVNPLSIWSDGRNYYHWLTDSLTRLMLREHLPEPTKILVPENAARFVTETLHLMDLADLCEAPKSKNLLPDRFYFCAPTAMTGAHNPIGYDWLRKTFKSYMGAAGSGSPVFFTRRSGTRVPPLLERLEKFFSSVGFEIVDCGELTVREQIRVTSSAPAIAGIHGAAMTNLLWAAPGTRAIELFQPDFLNACYEQIAFQGALDYSWQIIDDAFLEVALENWLG